MTEMDAQAAARWMLVQVTNTSGRGLYQVDAAEHIKKHFGSGLTYTNDNGNPAIDKKVLSAFRAISKDTVVWERGEKCWRQRTDSDPEGARQTN
ncbi:hypothetical protein vnz_37005 (plasmid) [Streptomyces venezuelae]|nr:hypothetical protein [Streptomyces venezuelae]APE26719.1 hypothetical protein vnz_37005 [Streptomyces venezuelae]